MLLIADPQAWASAQGYNLRPIQDINYSVFFGHRPLGALVKVAGGFKFVSECSTPVADVDYDQNISESFVSNSFGICDTEPTEGTNFQSSDKELTLGAQVSGTGQTERISECNFWLPYAAEHYHLSRNIRDYVLVPIPSIYSGLPNTNGDSLSLQEMLRFDPQIGMQMYKSFRGKPTYLEHCFPGDAPVQTQSGFKRISALKVGDKVLTDKCRFRTITHVYNNGRKFVSRIACHGIAGPIFATANHPFMVIDRRQIYGRLTQASKRDSDIRQEDLNWSDLQPHYRPVSDIYPGDFLAVPITIGGTLHEDPDFAFLAGAYVAEGSFIKYRPGHSKAGSVKYVNLTLGMRESAFIEAIVSSCKTLGYEHRVDTPRRGVTAVVIKDVSFAQRMLHLFGEYSHLKAMRNEARQWDDETLRNFLGGYISGDGSTKGGRLRCVTVSKILSYDIQNAFARLGIPATVTRNFHNNRKMRSPANGKEYACRTSYTVGASAHASEALNPFLAGKQILLRSDWSMATKCLVVGDYLLTPVTDIEHGFKKEAVYNLEVEEDHTYTAYSVVVHNCNKDITKAKGVILDSFLRPVPFNPGYYKIVLLLAYDRTKDPVLVNNILTRQTNAYSVGFLYSSYSCSVCGTRVGRGLNLRPCSHTQLGKPTYKQADGQIVFRRCENANGFECSSVGTPAFVSAVGPHVYDTRSL